jgi:hypothetical protein
MYLPPELAREIVNHLFELDISGTGTISEEPGVPSKQKWPLIKPLTLACRTYRALSLELWFHTLFIQSPMDIPRAHAMFPEIGRKWTRLVW